MRVDFIGFCRNTKGDISSLTTTALNALSKEKEELDNERDAEEIKLLEEKQEDCVYQKKRAFSYIDSMHNVLLDIFSQKTDEEILSKIKHAKEFLCFSEDWQPKEDCIITLK
ncbi:putative DNA-binding helix-hairpin-helix protein [Elusimicrobium posterum]|uniref:hypothetical protein n=1 Tax=Elusimicrobium posterum TaxID=3116653 RepID=UPI003C767E3E